MIKPSLRSLQMSDLFKEAFVSTTEDKQPASENTTMEQKEDIIEVTIGDEITPAANIPEQAIPPMSKLKQHRLKEKEDKEKRRMKRNVESSISRIKKNEAEHKKEKVKPMDMKHVKWNEAKKLALDVRRNISAYESVAATALMLVNRPDIEINKEAVDTVNSRANILTKDIQAFFDKWSEITGDMINYDGRVELDQFPIFYVIYQQLLDLQLDANNVLTDQADILGQMIQAIVDACNAEAARMDAIDKPAVETVEIVDAEEKKDE